MSVASRNPFDILSDDAESSPSAPTPSSEKTVKDQGSNAQATKANQRGRGPASRGGRYYQRGAGAGAKPAAPREQAPEGDDAPAREGKRGGGDDTGRGRGKHRGRGDRGARPGRGRPFDRHSATGKTDSDKKFHQGWGGDEGKSELKAEDDGSKDAAAEVTPSNDWGTDGNAAATTTTTTDGWGVPTDSAPGADAAAQPTEGRRPREEEEDNTLTLDQYLAQQKERSVVPKLETTRKANEGSDDTLWKGAVLLTKNSEDEYFSGKAKTSAPKQRSKTNEKVYLEIDAHFERPQRGRGRGEGRGGRGGRGSTRGGGRGARGRDTNGSAAVDVDNQAEFPSLS